MTTKTIIITNPSEKLLGFARKAKENSEKRAKELRDNWEKYFEKKDI